MTRGTDGVPDKIGGAAAMHDLTLDAALEHLMLDAQLVAHAQLHGRSAFLEREQRAELARIIGEVGDVILRDGHGTLAVMGVTMVSSRGELLFAKAGTKLRVRAGVDGVIEVGDHGVRPGEPFYTDELYREIQALIVAWAMAISGHEKSLWSTKG